MDEEPRRLRADAERNRLRLIEAATEMFAEHGLDVGVAEIAQRAGVGRGTLFRHFPSKEKLVVAVMAAQIRTRAERGRVRLGAEDPTAALFELIDEVPGYLEIDHAIVETLADEWMTQPEIQAAHTELLEVVEALLHRAQAAGTVRADVSAVDLVLMVKGVCESGRAFRHIDPGVSARQADLVKSAITASGVAAPPLRGSPPTSADLERAGVADT